MGNSEIDINDDQRWGGYVPWFLRHEGFAGKGDFLRFFDRLSHRMYQLFTFNEVGIPNLLHFGHILESKSLQKFKCPRDIGENIAKPITEYFSSCTLRKEMEINLLKDPEVVKLKNKVRDFEKSFGGKGIYTGLSRENNIKEIQEIWKKKGQSVETLMLSREEKYYRPLFIERLGVLEVLLQELPKNSDKFLDLVQDTRRYFAESNIMLEIETDSFKIRILEEPLLQREVIDKLIPRLESRFPERAKELMAAYHDMIGGKNRNMSMEIRHYLK
ncbi:MAG TPA: hypothetical protein ACFYEK_14085 [Candidatus Wunengus sp. YC60]|uniref:hypothetical protein n=1 Tax=Candidatus Wunengus sp. YC60 TaxID=3367697 RepID=UPI0040262EA0